MVPLSSTRADWPSKATTVVSICSTIIGAFNCCPATSELRRYMGVSRQVPADISMRREPTGLPAVPAAILGSGGNERLPIAFADT